MNNKMRKIISSWAVSTLLTGALLLPVVAHADDMHGTFATTKNGCSAGAKERIVFKEKTATGPSMITGSNFECALKELKPAGSGMMTTDALCVVDSENGTVEAEDSVDFDFGNYKDHFEVAIPKLDGWIKMYRCG